MTILTLLSPAADPDVGHFSGFLNGPCQHGANLPVLQHQEPRDRTTGRRRYIIAQRGWVPPVACTILAAPTAV